MDISAEDKLYTVPGLARELGITERAIRFYETKKLLSPRRAGNTRIFSYKDLARLVLILRGKRLGFSLAEIKKVIDLYDIDPKHRKQAKTVLKRVNDRISILEEQKKELDIALNELNAIKNNCTKILNGK